MLAYDFIKHFGDEFNIISIDRDNGDITDITAVEKIIEDNKPELLLNFAAYTNVEDAEDIWKKTNFDVNTLWVYNLAKLSAKYNIDFITLSTDYVFDGTKKEWYNENDIQNPINKYWMAKYLWEKLAKQENPNSIIIRTSWLYGWWIQFKNFVNSIIKLSETKKELKIINDQFGSPTYTIDLCKAIIKIINNTQSYIWKTLHLCNKTKDGGINWFEFSQEICRFKKKTKIKLIHCSSEEYITKAKRPKWSNLINNSDVILRSWKDGLMEYITNKNNFNY